MTSASRANARLSRPWRRCVRAFAASLAAGSAALSMVAGLGGAQACASEFPTTTPAAERSTVTNAAMTSAPAPRPVTSSTTKAGTALSVETAPQIIDGQIGITIDSLSSEVLTSESELTITGTIANGTDTELSNPRLIARMQLTPSVSTNELSSWLSYDRELQLGRISNALAGVNVPAGKSATFTMTIPASDLPSLSSQEWGPEGMELAVLDESSGKVLARDRSVLLRDTGTTVDPTRLTTIIPLVASPEELRLLQAATITDPKLRPANAGAISGSQAAQSTPTENSLTDLTERISGILSLAGPGRVILVDPSLLKAIGLRPTTPLPSQGNSGSAGSSSGSSSAEASASPSASASTTGSTASSGSAQGSASGNSGSSSGSSSSANSSASPSASASTSPNASASPSASASASASPSPTSSSDTNETQGEDSGVATAAVLSALRSRLATAMEDGTVRALPWADADAGALAHLGEGEFYAQQVTRGERAAEEWEMSSGVYLASGPLDQQTLNTLPASQSTVIADPADLPPAEDLFYTPSGTTVIGERTVLLPDADLAAAIAGEYPELEEDSPARMINPTGPQGESLQTQLNDLDSRQLLRADTAILTRQAPNAHRDVVLSVSRETSARLSPSQLRERLDALNTSWNTTQDLDALLASAAEDEATSNAIERQALPESSPQSGELSAEELAQARTEATTLTSMSQSLTDPAAALGVSTDITARSAASAWRAAPQERTASFSQARSAAEAVRAAITIAPSSTINVISQSADLPLRIDSTLSQEVNVVVRAESNNQRLQAEREVTVMVPPNGQGTAAMPINAVGSGDASLLLSVDTPDGTHIGTPFTLNARVRADWENRGTGAIAALLAVMLVAGIVRTVRRGRRHGMGEVEEPTPGARETEASSAPAHEPAAPAEPGPQEPQAEDREQHHSVVGQETDGLGTQAGEASKAGRAADDPTETGLAAANPTEPHGD